MCTYIYIYTNIHLHREDLVYDKHTGNLIGYTNLGEVNNHLFLAFADHPPDPAKSMLVKGLFTDLKYPYAQLSCDRRLFISSVLGGHQKTGKTTSEGELLTMK